MPYASASRSQRSGTREPSRRPLRIFPFDPMIDRFRDPVVSRVAFERVQPGPVGRLVEVVDEDATTGTRRPPLDLNASDVLIAQGLTPSESDYRFHQQMSYAVVMRVLEEFERGLGRPIVWEGLPRLTVTPHAGETANAWFDLERFALMLGYFRADATQAGTNLPGQLVYTCLSYDVLAHQCCHPVMMRLRPQDVDYGPEAEESGADARAYHEGMADLIAILVRFGESDVVANTIRDHGASLTGSPLMQIAPQFGQAIQLGPALRSYPEEPDPKLYQSEFEPHARGKLLTSAVLKAFVDAYRERTADLLRLNGGEPEAGYVHPDLVRRLADEASSLAAEVLRSLIASIDYLPPFDLRFHDVLRALLLTDVLLFGRSHHRFRALLIGSFHERGLVLSTAGSLSADALVLAPAERLVPELLPHAGDALLHTVTGLEWRRQHMVEPSRLRAVTAVLRRQQRQRATIWIPAIEAYARRQAHVLGLNAAKPLTATGLAGSDQVDSEGNLVARVFVTIAEPSSAGERRGVTLVCDSNGAVQYVVGAPGPTQPSTSGAT